MVKMKQFVDRFGKSSFPPAAALGAFVSFVGTAFRPRPEVTNLPNPRRIALDQIQTVRPESLQDLAREYRQFMMLGTDPSGRLFVKSLQGIALDSEDGIYILGDGVLKVFAANGSPRESWKAPEGALCLTVGSNGHIYFGRIGQVEIYSLQGKRIGGFSCGSKDKLAAITSIKILDQDIFVADATARIVRRYSFEGRQIGEIGNHGKMRGFMLPNGTLDIGITPQKTLYVSDPGRHRVSSWQFDGTPIGKFGKFGHVNAEDFVGCCNPVNLAVGPDGCIVTAEKVAARVKVYSPDGKLQGLIGPEHFDLRSVHLYLAVDSRNRIIVGDPVRFKIKIFTLVQNRGGDRAV
jgi:hypothetical protein